MVKNPPTDVVNARDAGSVPVLERSLEEEMATHSRNILWTEEPIRLQSMGSQRVGRNLATEHEHESNK